AVPINEGEQFMPATDGEQQKAANQQEAGGAQLTEDQKDILAGLAAIVNEVAGIDVDDVQPDKSFTEDLDVDSLSMVEVVVAAEEKFDVKIPDDDVQKLKTVRDAINYIDDARSAKA